MSSLPLKFNSIIITSFFHNLKRIWIGFDRNDLRVYDLLQVLRDKESGKSRAFGFITFACTFMAEAALEGKEHIINGRMVEPRLATPDVKKLEMSEPEYMRQLVITNFLLIFTNDTENWFK